MAHKARHPASGYPLNTISVDRLFSAAFDKSEYYYQKESLWGWRPVEAGETSFQKRSRNHHGADQTTAFTNSPDVKIRETDDLIIIEVTMPEINEESLYLEISGDLLIIRAEQISGDSLDYKEGTAADRPMVHRYIKLPVFAQPGNVQARWEDNVVRVKIGKILPAYDE